MIEIDKKRFLSFFQNLSKFPFLKNIFFKDGKVEETKRMEYLSAEKKLSYSTDFNTYSDFRIRIFCITFCSKDVKGFHL